MVSDLENLMTMHRVCPAHFLTPTVDPQKSARISETAGEVTRAEVIVLENQEEAPTQGEEAVAAVVLCPGFETA